MKRTLVLVFSLFLGLAAVQAQQQFVTLQHGNAINAFYGANAFKNAYNASVNGDIITLSPGSFSAPSSITKYVTIRGAGMFNDTALGIYRTTILDGFILGGGTVDSLHIMTLEGLFFSNTVHTANLYHPIITKCYFKNYADGGTNNGTVNEAQIISCVMEKFELEHFSLSLFFNCVIVDNCRPYYSDGTNSFYNCILMVEPQSGDGINKASYYNCILSSSNSGDANNYLTSYNCIGIAPSNNYYPSAPNSYNLHNYHYYSDVFKVFNGIYSEGMNMELNDSIAATILGSDGTQVGIYGGQFPFNPRVLNYKATVANQSRPDGKLEVTVQPVNE